MRCPLAPYQGQQAITASPPGAMEGPEWGGHQAAAGGPATYPKPLHQGREPGGDQCEPDCPGEAAELET